MDKTQTENLEHYDCICYEDSCLTDDQVKQLVLSILHSALNLPFSVDDNTWEKTKVRANGYSNTNTDVDDLNEHIMNPDIVVTERVDYRDSSRTRTKYVFRCKRHSGFTGESSKQTLMKNANERSGCPGCPQCSAEKNTEKYAHDVHEINPHLEILSFATQHEPVKVRCVICDESWSNNHPATLRSRTSHANCLAIFNEDSR